MDVFVEVVDSIDSIGSVRAADPIVYLVPCRIFLLDARVEAADSTLLVVLLELVALAVSV